MRPNPLSDKPEDRVRFVVRASGDPLVLDGPNVIRNLTGSPKRISPVYVYDARGSALFERQCATPEYYLRRSEAALLKRHAAEVCELSGFARVVELGAGTAEKTRTLLAEYASRGLHCDYFPIDVDTQTLSVAALSLAADFPQLHVHCLGTTYENGLHAAAGHSGATLWLFLGASIGNMDLPAIDLLLSDSFLASQPGDHLLIGADLDKDPAVINRAYNDAAGFGARSTLNMLSHLNHRYAANFVVENFCYRSEYDVVARRNDVRIVSLVDQDVTLARLGFTVSFAAGETIEAEVMWKFDPDELEARCARAGWGVRRRWIASADRYGLFLLRRP
jgi:L-histidine Nalpha-methyltransferase